MSKPRGRMTPFAFYMYDCRMEHKNMHPTEDESAFAEFAPKCVKYWQSLDASKKRIYEEMAAEDKIRYEKEMSTYVPGETKRKRKKKDPNAPKRALSSFFFFCAEERPSVNKEFPGYGVGDVARELGKRWKVCPNRPKFEELAVNDKKRYELEMMAYKRGAAPAKKTKPAATVVVEEDEKDEDEERGAARAKKAKPAEDKEAEDEEEEDDNDKFLR